MAYAFHFDAAACSGCKACVAACADRHALPAALRWRRVYEVGGGGWTKRGGAWLNDVVAYSVSVACSHCERAICVEVCPTGAMYRRTDGLVLLAADRCIGCRLCEWSCPYGAPQFDAESGCMTKCTGCADDVAAGRTPACVAACGLRALDFGDAAELAARHAAGTRAVPPLPDPSLTQPSLWLTPPAALRGWSAHTQHTADIDGTATDGDAAATRPLRILNGEELDATVGGTGLHEPSLVAFTLLVQGAVGAFVGVAMLDGLERIAAAAAAQAYAYVAAVATAAMVVSLLHLGRPGRAWRAAGNLKTSWLSREVLFTALFAAGSAVAAAAARGDAATVWSRAAVLVATAAAGAAALYSMTRVYLVRTVPAWNRVATPLRFLQAAGAVGLLFALLLLLPGPPAVGVSPSALAQLALPRGPGWLAFGAALCLLPVLLEDALRRARRGADDGSGVPIAAAFAIVLSFLAASGSVAGRAQVILAAAALAAACLVAGALRVRFFRDYQRSGL